MAWGRYFYDTHNAVSAELPEHSATEVFKFFYVTDIKISLPFIFMRDERF